MAIPMTGKADVFNAITADTTTELNTLAGFGGNVAFGSTLLIEVVGAAATTWTLDFRGRITPDDTYTNIDFQQIWQAGAAAISNSQLSVTDATRRYYVIRNTPQMLQFVSARTAGTGALTVRVSLTSEPFSQDILTTVRGSIFAEGPVAHDAVLAGNPVRVGMRAVAPASLPVAVAAGDVVDATASVRGVPFVSLTSDSENGQVLVQDVSTDGRAGTNIALVVDSRQSLLSGTTWDRARGNFEATVFASAARTTTANSADATNYDGRSVKFVLDITAVSGTPTLDVKIQGKDTLSSTYQDITGAAFAQKTGVSTDDLTLALGVTVVANRSVSNVVPRIFRAVATIAGGTPSLTFSLSANIIK